MPAHWFYNISFWIWAGKCKWEKLFYLGILVYSEPFKHLMGLFAKIVNVFQPLENGFQLLEEVKRIGSSKLAVNE